jgi:hypothetical protein
VIFVITFHVRDCRVVFDDSQKRRKNELIPLHCLLEPKGRGDLVNPEFPCSEKVIPHTRLPRRQGAIGNRSLLLATTMADRDSSLILFSIDKHHRSAYRNTYIASIRIFICHV